MKYALIARKCDEYSCEILFGNGKLVEALQQGKEKPVDILLHAILNITEHNNFEIKPINKLQYYIKKSTGGYDARFTTPNLQLSKSPQISFGENILEINFTSSEKFKDVTKRIETKNLESLIIFDGDIENIDKEFFGHLLIKTGYLSPK